MTEWVIEALLSLSWYEGTSVLSLHNFFFFNESHGKQEIYGNVLNGLRGRKVSQKMAVFSSSALSDDLRKLSLVDFHKVNITG